MSEIHHIDNVGGGALIEDSADVVIIGTGPGGATAARVLTEAGVDVIMIEEGAPYPAGLRRGDAWSAMKLSWRDRSFQIAKGRSITPMIQGCAVGGSTPINGAIIHRTPAPIIANWAKKHGMNEVINEAGLNRVFGRLDEELSVAPTPKSAWGNNNRLFGLAADRLGWKAAPTSRSVAGCEGTARCNQGCPTAVKQSMDVTYIPQAMARGARTYATCRAEKLLRDGDRAAGVEGRFRDPLSGRVGPLLRVKARRAVIVSAGAIHTPVFLQNNRAGRSSGQLGKNLICHPGTSLIADFEEPVDFWFGATQGYECTEFWGELMKFEVVGLPPSVAVARLPGYGPELMRSASRIRHLAHWGLQVRATSEGSVRRGMFGGRPSIKYSINAFDVSLMKKAYARLVEMAFAAGAKRVLPGVPGIPQVLESYDGIRPLFDLPDDPRLFHCIAAHLFGTAAIGTEANNSVVSETGEVWDTPGLYVMDASNLPTNMGVNPQHTICGVSWLMSERLADVVSA